MNALRSNVKFVEQKQRIKISALPEAFDTTVEIWRLYVKLQSMVTPRSVVNSHEDDEKPPSEQVWRRFEEHACIN